MKFVIFWLTILGIHSAAVLKNEGYSDILGKLDNLKGEINDLINDNSNVEDELEYSDNGFDPSNIDLKDGGFLDFLENSNDHNSNGTTVSPSTELITEPSSPSSNFTDSSSVPTDAPSSPSPIFTDSSSVPTDAPSTQPPTTTPIFSTAKPKAKPIHIGTCSNWTTEEGCRFRNFVRNKCQDHQTCQTFVGPFSHECLVSHFMQLTCPRSCRTCQKGSYISALPFNGNQACNSRDATFQAEIDASELRHLSKCEGKDKVDICASFLYRWGLRYPIRDHTTVDVCMRSPGLSRPACKRLRDRRFFLRSNPTNLRRARFQFRLPCDVFEATTQVRRGSQGIDIDEASIHIGKCNEIEFPRHVDFKFRSNFLSAKDQTMK